MASNSNFTLKSTEAGAIAFKVELPEDSDSSFIIEDDTILVGKGNDLQDKNLNCEITYEMLFPNDGTNSEDNKKNIIPNLKNLLKTVPIFMTYTNSTVNATNLPMNTVK